MRVARLFEFFHLVLQILPAAESIRTVDVNHHNLLTPVIALSFRSLPARLARLAEAKPRRAEAPARLAEAEPRRAKRAGRQGGD